MKSVNNNTYNLENAMSELFSKLDEGIDDMENERLISEEEDNFLNKIDRGIDDMEDGRELLFEEAFQTINELRRFGVL